MEVSYILFQICIALLTVVAYYVYRNLSYFKRLGVPHEQPHLLHGNMKGLRKDRTMHEIFIEYYKKFKPTKAPFCGFYFLHRPTIFVLDQELIKNVLIRDFPNFTDKGRFHNDRNDPLSAHLFNLDGEKWKNLRKKLSSTFTSGKMKFMYPTVLKVANEFVAVLKEMVEQKDEIEFKDLLAKFTTDVIGNCVFGIECNSLRDPKSEFSRMGMFALTHTRHGNFLTGFLQSFPKLAARLGIRKTHEAVHQFYMRIVRETINLREQQGIKRNDFMDLLIELKNKKTITLDNGEVLSGLTINEVVAQAFVFFIAGFDTSASTMGFVLHELAQHQDIQQKLREEINETLKKNNNELTYECLKDFIYLDQVLSETLRLHSILPNLDRKARNRYVVPNHPEYVIEAGMTVIIPIVGIHLDPELFPEPEEFRPERFSPEECVKRDSSAWLPFGDGPRNCIGLRFGRMQAKIGLALLIKNFKFSVCSATEIPLTYNPHSFLLSVTGITLKVERVL